MHKYRDIVIDNRGNAIKSATITVTVTSSGAVASIFSDNGVTAESNPFTSSSVDGAYEFYVANGRYTITVTKTGYDTEALTDISIGGGEGDDPGVVYRTRQLLKNYSEVLSINAAAAGSVPINMEDGNVHRITLTGNASLTFTNPAASGEVSNVTLRVIQGGSGSYVITWPGTVQWPGGIEPTVTAALGTRLKYVFDTDDGGAIWDGQLAGDNYS